jgi:hypothetical protein
MTRYLLSTTININNKKIKISTIHLESLMSQELRKIQLDLIYEYLKKYEYSIFLGDFNFGDELSCYGDDNKLGESHKLENDYLIKLFENYIDNRKYFYQNLNNINDDKKDENNEIYKGFSYDFKNNLVIRNQFRSRIDRILSKNLDLKNICFIGYKSFKFNNDEDKLIEYFASDHFGLLSKYNFF